MTHTLLTYLQLPTTYLTVTMLWTCVLQLSISNIQYLVTWLEMRGFVKYIYLSTIIYYQLLILILRKRCNSQKHHLRHHINYLRATLKLIISNINLFLCVIGLE